MKISMIAALSENGVIGNQGKLPWHLPEDLQYFKKMTLNKPVVMGRKTFESIGRPLPQRQNIILTEDQNFKVENCTIVHSREEALKVLVDFDEVMIIGGAKIYQLFLPLAQRLYLTLVHKNVVGDTYFPKLNWKQWQKSSEENHPLFSFVVYDRIM